MSEEEECLHVKWFDAINIKIAELKENINIVADNSGNFEDMLLTKINNLSEVLRDLLKELKFAYEVHDEIYNNRSDAAWSSFYDKLLQRLSGATDQKLGGEKASSASHTGDNMGIYAKRNEHGDYTGLEKVFIQFSNYTVVEKEELEFLFRLGFTLNKSPVPEIRLNDYNKLKDLKEKYLGGT